MRRKSLMDVHEAAMEVAALWAELRSKGNTRVGAAVVHGPSGGLFLGYNGFPPGAADEEELWSTKDKHALVIHAEENAVNKALGALGHPLKDCCLVTTTLPCTACIRRAVGVGIKLILWRDDRADMLKSPDEGRSRDLLLQGTEVQLLRMPPTGKVTVTIERKP